MSKCTTIKTKKQKRRWKNKKDLGHSCVRVFLDLLNLSSHFKEVGREDPKPISPTIPAPSIRPTHILTS